MYERRDVPPPYDDPVDDPVRPGYPVRTYDRVETYEAPVAVAPYNYRAVQVVWFVIGVVVALVALRFAFKLLGASPQAQFVAFIYGVTAPLVAPFRGIFPDTVQGFYVFEAASLFAIVIYLLLGWGIASLVKIVTAPRGRRPTL
jgi:uncharacterized protein YggT (Ycf19 family)